MTCVVCAFVGCRVVVVVCFFAVIYVFVCWRIGIIVLVSLRVLRFVVCCALLVCLWMSVCFAFCVVVGY